MAEYLVQKKIVKVNPDKSKQVLIVSKVDSGLIIQLSNKDDESNECTEILIDNDIADALISDLLMMQGKGVE